MATAEKTARSMLKEANELGNTLREIVRRDIADETRRFNDTLSQRIQLASEAIIQAVKAKEAITAGASSISSKLEKAHRKYSKNNNIEEFREILRSTLTEFQLLREQHETVAKSLREAQTPSRSAVEIVERFAIELQKAAGGWEATGREIDEIIANMCDPNPDVALIELEKYLTENGFEIVLVGDNRSEEALEEARRQLGYSDSSE
jgi:transglutaminase/protease-like cytokinesis protein 3